MSASGQSGRLENTCYLSGDDYCTTGSGQDQTFLCKETPVKAGSLLITTRQTAY